MEKEIRKKWTKEIKIKANLIGKGKYSKSRRMKKEKTGNEKEKKRTKGKIML